MPPASVGSGSCRVPGQIMTNRLITILFLLIVTVAIIGQAAHVFLSPPDRWQQWLQVLVAQQIADTLEREVQLGPITDLSMEGVGLHGLAVAEGPRLADGVILTADTIRIAFDLAGMLRRRTGSAADISRVRIEGAWVHLVRDEVGALNIEDVLPEPPPVPVPPEERFQGIITIADSTVIYDDYALPQVAGTFVNAELVQFNAEIDMRTIGWIDFDLSGRDRLGRFGSLHFAGMMEPDTGFLWGQTQIGSVDMPYWFERLVVAPEIDVIRGRAEVAATVGIPANHDGAPTVSGKVAVRDSVLTLDALGRRPVSAEADASVTLEGVQMHRLVAQMDAMTVEASGFLGDLDDPVVDLAFDADVPRSDELVTLFPDLSPEMEEQIASVTIAGPLLVSGEIAGPLREANVVARVGAPGEVRYASADVGEWVAEEVDLRVDLLDLSDPNVRARADTVRTTPTDLEPLAEMMPEDLEGPLEVAAIDDLAVDLLWSAEVPLLQTELAVPRITVGDLVVEDIHTEVALAGDLIRLSNLTARPLGATLSAEALLDLAGEETPWAYARGSIDGVELTRLHAVPGLEEFAGDLSGVFSGHFVAELDEGAPLVLAQAVVDRPHYQKYGVRSLRGLVVVDADAVQVRAGSFEDLAGVGWVNAVMPFEAEMAANFGIAGVDLERVTERFELDLEDLRGEAFITGMASGTPDDPHLDVRVRAFQVNYQDYGVDAVRAGIEGDFDELRVIGLHASTGRILAQVDGTLRNIELDDSDADIEGTVVFAGPVDEHARDLAGLEGEDVSGVVRASVDVGGTLKRPNADGIVTIGFARYETVATDDATIAVRLEGDTLELRDLRMAIGDALVSGQATVTSLYDEPIVAANMTAESVVLQDLAPWQDLAVPLSGEVSVPFLSLQGPLDNLTGLAQVEAVDLELGVEPIGAMSATLVLDRNALMLRRTSLALAGGTMALEGQYRLDERRVMPSRVDLDDVSLPALLRAGIPLAERFVDTAPEEEAEERERLLSRQLASLSMRLGGRLDASITGEGVLPEEPIEDEEDEVERYLEAFLGEMTASAREVTVDGRLVPDTSVRAEVGEGARVAVDAEAQEGEGLITLTGTWDPEAELMALAEITFLDIARLREWMPPAVRAAGGELNLTVQASGPLDGPDLIGSLDVVGPEAYGVSFDLISAPIIRYDGTWLDVDSLVVRENDEEMFIDGRLPFDWATRSVPSDAELQMAARADGIDLAIFPPLVAGAMATDEDARTPMEGVDASGVVNALLTVGGTVSRPELDGELKIDAPAIEVPWTESPIEDTQLSMYFRGVEQRTIVELETLSSRIDAVTMQATGTAELMEYDLERLTENAYDFRFEVAGPQHELPGGLTARQIRGDVTFVTNERGEQVVTVTDLGADFGDGSVLMDGTVEMKTFEFAQLERNAYDLAIVADRARGRYDNMFLGTLNGRFTMTNPAPDEPMRLGGRMTVSNATIGVPRPAEADTEELMGMSADFPALRFDAQLGIGHDVEVRTLGLVAPLEPTERAVIARGTPQRPNIQGQIELQEGAASMPGGVIDIQTAGVRFLVRPGLGTERLTPPIVLDFDGQVWANATRTVAATVVDGREVGPVEIDLRVSGTLPENIHVEVSSTPPLAEEQIYALLGTAPFADGEGLFAGRDLEQVMTEQFVSALGAAFRTFIFDPFEEELRDILGLEFLEVSFAFDQPIALRMGGYLIEDLLITYETVVTGGREGYDLGVSYRIERRFEVSYRTDERHDHRLFVEKVFRF